MIRRSRRRRVSLAIVCLLALIALASTLGTDDDPSPVDSVSSSSSAAQVAGGPPGLEAAPAQPAQPATAPSGGPDERGAGTSPGYDELVTTQIRKPKSRFTPCNLVTRSQAEAIIGRPILAPIEAPQGPTCIYRAKTGTSATTLEVQRADFATLKRGLRDRRRLQIAGRTAYCGTLGRPILYMPVSDGRVLSIAAPCGVARQFATRATPRLES